MKVRIRLFASLRELAGSSEMEVELPLGSKVEDLRARILGEVPVLGPSLATVAYAINDDFVSLHWELEDGDEVALIPPVSGGGR